MRKLTDHIVSGDQAVQLEIDVLDDPGAGGANHEYLIAWRDKSEHSQTQTISFQNGPIQESGVNGITNEALLAIVIDRMRGFQGELNNEAPFRCRENAIALTYCEEAIMWLQRRTVARIKRGVEGTHQR